MANLLDSLPGIDHALLQMIRAIRFERLVGLDVWDIYVDSRQQSC